MLLNKSIQKIVPIALAFALSGIPLALSAPATKSLTAVGPVESLNCSTKRFQVLGITFSAGSSALLKDLCDPNNHDVFKFVAVEGVVGSKDSVLVVKLNVVAQANYTPGSSYVYLKGIVTSQAPKVGEFRIAGSRIDSSTGLVPAVDAYIQVVGTQPALNGKIIAAAVGAADGLVPDPSFEAAMSGIVGSGVAASGIVGSGVVAAGIVGSGVTVNGIVGSGVTVNGIVGSGVTVNGIVGSGVAKNGIVGSGVATNGLLGSALN